MTSGAAVTIGADDVTVVVLSLGEALTARARAAIAAQDRAPAAVEAVVGVTPNHRALNAASARVSTPFWVQVDSDFVLDPDALRRLRACAVEGVGSVRGGLRDPLVGRYNVVKLFRTECTRAHPFGDNASPDTDQRDALLAAGWSVVGALRWGDGHPWPHTFGEHRPEYTGPYVLAKFLVEGQRFRYRRHLPGLVWLLDRLRASDHPRALLARLATGHGLFQRTEGDLLAPYGPRDEWPVAAALLGEDGAGDASGGSGGGRPWSGARVERVLLPSRPEAVLERALRLGTALGAEGDGSSLAQALDGLATSRHPWDWLAQVGLAHGVFADGGDPAVGRAAADAIDELLAGGPSRTVRAAWVRSVVRRARAASGAAGAG